MKHFFTLSCIVFLFLSCDTNPMDIEIENGETASQYFTVTKLARVILAGKCRLIQKGIQFLEYPLPFVP